mgnify:CR=1 FL=1
MWGMTKKRFLVTLGMAIGVWVFSVFLQYILGVNIKYNFFSGPCQITGFPLVSCYFSKFFILVDIINVIFYD